MERHRASALVLAFVVATVGGIAACGDDDNAAGPPTQDSGPPPPPPPADAGPCDFNDYVTGLIQNNTNATSLPDETLGDNCVDNQTPFPESFFQ
jgi:hypothetical protein